MPLYLNNADQEASITAGEANEALENALRQFALGDGIRRPRIDNVLPTSREGEWFNFSSMEGGFRRPGYYALRIKPDIVVESAQRVVKYSYKPGLYGGLVLLYSTDNAEFLAIMNDGYVQHLRVACSGALGVKFLSRPDSRVLGIIGSGFMARFFALAVAAIRPISVICVWSPTRAHLETYAREMQPKVAAEIRMVESPEAVARGADIICSCTSSRRPVIQADWIKPGTHLNNVIHDEFGADVMERVDAVGLLVRRTPMKVSGFVDDDFGWNTSGALCYLGGQPHERARFPQGKPNADRYAASRVVDCIDWRSGIPYQRRDGEITLLANSSQGTLEGEGLVSAGIQGIQFAAVSGRIYENAVRAGLGTTLPREMFLQDIPT